MDTRPTNPRYACDPDYSPPYSGEWRGRGRGRGRSSYPYQTSYCSRPYRGRGDYHSDRRDYPEYPRHVRPADDDDDYRMRKLAGIVADKNRALMHKTTASQIEPKSTTLWDAKPNVPEPKAVITEEIIEDVSRDTALDAAHDAAHDTSHEASHDVTKDPACPAPDATPTDASTVPAPTQTSVCVPPSGESIPPDPNLQTQNVGQLTFKLEDDKPKVEENEKAHTEAPIVSPPNSPLRLEELGHVGGLLHYATFEKFTIVATSYRKERSYMIVYKDCTFIRKYGPMDYGQSVKSVVMDVMNGRVYIIDEDVTDMDTVKERAICEFATDLTWPRRD